MRVLIAPDKFKGTLSAVEAARAIATGWALARPNDQIERLPITDGGDGFGGIISSLLRCRPRVTRTVDAAHRACRSTWFWHAPTRTAVIESAATIGLWMLPRRKYHPFQLDTFGLGAVLKAAAGLRPRQCIIGIGGSATNDGGFGLACAVGWRFVDSAGREIKQWTDLDRLERIVPPRPRRLSGKILVAMDVRNPLLGKNGASRIYGPQKGLRRRDFVVAERCLSRLALIMKRQFRSDVADVPGSGAAGGLGFGLMAFLKAKPANGFDLFARCSRLKERLRAVDCVITGEGKLDSSTAMGKSVSGLAEFCSKFNIPCIALAGVVDLSGQKLHPFSAIRSLAELTTLKQAKTRPAFHLARLASICAKEWSRNSSV